ncbi:hypothetical protein HN419_02245 [Candidatus Woesearchaeota archaeon]|jgi:hypothetical protein|nr:hypothetical protein [Candidatus Woesearchaeota archaeon]MBT3537182.1 hypothetical protein [Candidatus Woesearchaeota archaeon]MBT4696672.1 hypothetical protein [Candidatus Woesearchaeota archaeon]MBT4716474.1 hypothetical protein [Candidatus Woesearchaeota archaeon]MBT7106508.1 hypothetical protein [Candidatus Woesearchaeota archaeon]
MRTFELGQADLYLGDHERCGSLESIADAQTFLDEKLNQFFGNTPEYREYIDLYGLVHGLEKYALLAAHADTNGEWVYFDEGREHSVQSWVNEVDGNYSGLLLCVCNPGSHTPNSAKSILLVSDSDIDYRTGERDPIFSLLVPEVGELYSYTVGYELEQLRTQLDRF